MMTRVKHVPPQPRQPELQDRSLPLPQRHRVSVLVGFQAGPAHVEPAQDEHELPRPRSAPGAVAPVQICRPATSIWRSTTGTSASRRLPGVRPS